MKLQTTKAPPQAAPDYSKLEALQDLTELLEKRQKLEWAAAELPQAILAAESELDDINVHLADAEVAIIEVTQKGLPGALKQRDAFGTQQLDCELRGRRLRSQLDAIEARIPEIDAQIQLAIGAVRSEAGMASDLLRDEITREIDECIEGLQLAFAKVRALQHFLPTPVLSDFLTTAYVPHLPSCMVVGGENRSPNLLDKHPKQAEHALQANAQIAAVLKPIADALVAGRKHRLYVPISKRPKPYEYRGSNQGPRFGAGGPIGKGEPPLPREPEIKREPIDVSAKSAEPYRIKGDSGGMRTRGAVQDMNIAAAMVGSTLPD